MAAGILFWFFSLVVGFLHRLRCRVFDRMREPHYPNTVVVGSPMTFIKYCFLQNPKLGAFELLISSFLPGHQRPQWLPECVVSAQMRTVVWVLLALGTQPILVSALATIAMRDCSLRTGCIRFPIFACRPFLTKAFVGFCPYPVFNLPRQGHRHFLLHPSFPRLLLIVRLFLSRFSCIFSHLAGTGGFISLNLFFHPLPCWRDRLLEDFFVP